MKDPMSDKKTHLQLWLGIRLGTEVVGDDSLRRADAEGGFAPLDFLPGSHFVVIGMRTADTQAEVGAPTG